MTPPDHFALFGLPPRFDIDQAELERRYRELSREHHPDKQAKDDRLQAVQQTADLNLGYKVLRDDFQRAEHLLRRLGVETTEADAQDNRQTVATELLMEIMTIREALDEARQSKDHAAVEKLAADVNARVERAWGSLRTSFSKHGSDAKADDLRPLVNELTQLRYYRRVLEEVANILDEDG